MRTLTAADEPGQPRTVNVYVRRSAFTIADLRALTARYDQGEPPATPSRTTTGGCVWSLHGCTWTGGW